MTFDAAIIFFISMLLMWIKPGPAQLLKITIALDKGLLPALSFALGSVFMCAMFFAMVSVGYKALTDVFNFAGVFLQVFGAVYLAYISIKGLIKFYKNTPLNNRDTDNPDIIGNKKGVIPYVILGVLATISSPFWLFYFIGILPSLLPFEKMTGQGLFVGIFLIFLSNVMVDGPMLTLVTQLQKMFLGGNIARYINLFVSLSFLLIAGFLLYSVIFTASSSFELDSVL